MSTVFVTLAGACTMGMGYLPYWMMYQCYTGSFLFYLAHWQTYVTGQMRFGNFDVTEAQMCMMFVMMCSAMFGTEFWSLKLLGFLPLRWLPLVFATLAALLSLPSTVNKILFGGAGKNGSSVAVSVFDDIRIVLLLIKIIRASHPI
jgi:choline/ethanolamine phosphotransferase